MVPMVTRASCDSPTGAVAHLTIRMLGPFEALVGGRRLAVSGRLLSLLAILALAVPEGVPADVLARRVWDDAFPTRAGGSLRVLIARLRRLIGPDSIITQSGGYHLRSVPQEIDALHFEHLLDGATLARHHDRERQLLEHALALWRGRPFDGIRSGWLADSERPRLVDRYLQAVTRRIDLDIAADQHRDLVVELRELTARYPMNEPLWARLLQVLNANGRPAEALATYEGIRARLRTELGTDPSHGLRTAHALLLAGDATPDYVDVTPRQLPLDLPTFTGRTEALTELDTLLAAGGPRPGQPTIVAGIVGAAGIGKTALAVRWAHRVKDQFAGGQIFINLCGHGSDDPLEPLVALDVLLSSLGIPKWRIPTELQARADLFQSRIADKQTLLLLDDVRSSEQLWPLLPTSSCLVLITSRGDLDILVGRRPGLRTVLERLSSAESVAFLTKMLRRRWVGHEGVDGMAPPSEAALAVLAEQCEHHPLALAIVAERMQHHPHSTDLSDLAELARQIIAERNRLEAANSLNCPLSNIPMLATWS